MKKDTRLCYAQNRASAFMEAAKAATELDFKAYERITRPLTCRYAEEPEPQGASDKKRDAPPT